MVSEKFRHQLRKEVEKWQKEGLINSEQYRQLAQRYQFSQLDNANRDRFVAILISLGSILIGLAVITFVAANWQAWSRELKVFLLISLFVGVNTTGFYLWRERSVGWKSRLGQGLLLLGALILGSNLALMSQMFHQSGAVYVLYLIWAIGVLVMAYSLKLTSLGIVAIILTAISYGTGILNFWENGGNEYELISVQWLDGFGQELHHLPLLTALLFIPLAYWCQSRWLFGLSLVLITVSYQVNLLIYSSTLKLSSGWQAWLWAIAVSLPPGLLWAYQDFSSVSFKSISRKLAIFILSFFFYLFSFHYWWDDPFSTSSNDFAGHYWLVLFNSIILGIINIGFWWKLGQRQESNHLWRLDNNSTIVGIMILTTGILIWWQQNGHVLGAIATIIFNLFLFLLAVGSIRQALATGKRLGFWTGIILLSLQLFSRMLEYNTGLLIKALVLFGCGVAVIMAGIWFERYLHTFNSSSSN